MRVEVIEVLVGLLMLQVQDRPDLDNYDESFDKLTLIGQVAALLDAEAELGEAMLQRSRLARS